MNDSLIKKTTAFFEVFLVQHQVLSPEELYYCEHIDYNDGFVYRQQLTNHLFCFRENSTSKIIAIDLDDSFEVDLTTEMELTDNVWTNYIEVLSIN
jgi:galactokinase